jgi:hypothetical protein
MIALHAYTIVQMINTFDSDPDATFQQDDFDVLFQSDSLASFRMTTHRWGLFFDAIKSIQDMDDPEFPLLDFITFVLKLEGIQLHVLNFFVDFKSQLGQFKKTSQTFSLKYGYSSPSSKNQWREEFDSNDASNIDQNKFKSNWKSNVNITVTLPQFDGKKGEATRFVTRFIRLMENQKYHEEEWDSLLMDCLNKEALMHFETSRSNFDSTQDYFKDLIKFFDNRSLNDEKRFYKDNFRQLDNESIHSFYLRFLEKTKQLQTLAWYIPFT